MIFVLRLGHRVSRDKRVTSHIALTARALGADGVIISGEEDRPMIKSIEDVAERWGGTFSCKYEKDWKGVIGAYKEKGYKIVHLTFYGLPIRQKIEEIRNKDALVIVGAEKVPKDLYYVADYNISITNQPHSEISALAIFLHEYFKGKELEKTFENARIKIIPRERGKKVLR
jgi:tRNA (cytidine56-2'-O)-methyltransferase